MKSELGFEGFVNLPLPNARLLRRLFGAKRSIVIFDIGSCEGEDSIRYAKFFPNSHIHAFEPIPDNLTLIKKNIRNHRLSRRITVNDTALSLKRGKTTMYVSSGAPEDVQNTTDWDYGNKSSSLLAPDKIAEVTPWLSFKKKISVQTDTLDNYCKHNRIAEIDIIHMDVQGAELMVLDGAKNMIKNINCIWLEVENVKLYKDQPVKKDVELFMKKHGFTCIVDTVGDVAGDQLYVSDTFIEAIPRTLNSGDYFVSVVIPTYNRASMIIKAIESVVTQSTKDIPLEIIVVDDGSTDDTERVVRSLKNKNIYYHKLSHSGQPAVARNYGVSVARGNLVAFLDSDDIWMEHKLRDQLLFFEDEQTVLVYGQAKLIHNDQLKASDLVSLDDIDGGESFLSLLKTNSISNSTAIVRKDAFDSVGGYNTSKMLSVEDYHLWLRLCIKFPNSIKYCGTPVAFYRRHDESISNVNPELAARRILTAHEMILEDANTEQKDAIYSQIKNDHINIKYHHHKRKETPLISVVMSVFNGENYLRDAVDSILSQTFTLFEFIIINDGSIDGTSDILASYDDPRIYIVNQQNHGLVYSLNLGCSIASGTYIARMDADDISLPSRFEKQIQLLSSDPALSLIGGYFTYINEAGNLLGTTITSPTKDVDLRRALYIVNPFAHGSTMYKKSTWLELEGYTDEYGPTEDYELWRRFSDHTGNKFGLVPEVLYLYRINLNGISQQKTEIQSEYANKIIDEQWNKPFIGKGTRSIIADGKYYKSLSSPVSDQVFSNYYYQELHIMNMLFIKKHFLTGLRLSTALLILRPKWNRVLIMRTIGGGFLRKIGVKE